MRRTLSALAAVLALFFGVLTFAPSVNASESVTSACSALEGTCCACNSSSCIEVAHDGVASCTFEFCSDTPCTYTPE